MGNAGPGMGIAILPAIMFIGVLAAWIIAIVALWRGMKAHESIAESLKTIAENRK